MEWTNILKRKRSKHHSSRKIRRGRNVHQRFHRPKGGVPLEGHADENIDDGGLISIKRINLHNLKNYPKKILKQNWLNKLKKI